MQEALAQYSLHTSWVLGSYPADGWRSYNLPLDRSKIQRLEVNAGYLLLWTSQSIAPSDDPKQQVWFLAQDVKEMCSALEVVRFQGYAHEDQCFCIRPNTTSWIAGIFRDMRDMFEGVEVGTWRLEVVQMHQMWRTEIVYELMGDELVTVGDERLRCIHDGHELEEPWIDIPHTKWCKRYVAKMENRFEEQARVTVSGTRAIRKEQRLQRMSAKEVQEVIK